MRLFSLSLLLGTAGLAVAAVAPAAGGGPLAAVPVPAPAPADVGVAAPAAVADASPPEDTQDSSPDGTTIFNNKKVPPMLEITEDTWETERKASKWLFVKHYSPYCHHCIAFAPTWQTMYEYYYTSTPGGKGNEDKDFTDFYSFRFASINCVAFADLCDKHGIHNFPTMILYKDGEPVETLKGAKKMDVFTAFVEDSLERTKPGTRPTTQSLPKPGDKSAPPPSFAKKPTAMMKPAKPVAAPNPNGTSIPLDAEAFQSLVTMTRDPWFIKFYAPWCHHCQALAPNWDQLAKQMKGKLNVGEVNCDANARLCKDARLRGYPTILFFRGGERVEYEGLRGLGDLLHYAEKANEIANGVQDVDAESLAALEKREDVVFVYFYDHATTSEDFMALERLPLSLIGHARLVKTRDPELYERFKITTWPRLLASREGRPTYYTPLTPNEMRNVGQVLDWMRSVWLPIVPELTAANAREIMDHKIVVLGILSREDPESFQGAIREMKSAANEWMDKQIQLFQLERQELRDAKQLRLEEAEDRGDQRALRAAKLIHINMDRSDRKEVAFAWVDGVFWQRWLRQTYGIDIKDGERVIINDEDNRRYWDQTITGNPITPSRTSILETINKVTASPPKIKYKLTISSLEKVFFDIRMAVSEHRYLSLGCALGVALGCASWFRGRLLRRAGRGAFRLEDSVKDFKAPSLSLLGGINTNGKVD